MTLLLYGITDGDAQPAGGGAGVAAAPLRRIGSGGLVALVSEHEGPPPFDEDSLWAFERAIEAQMDATTVLPARFGSLLEEASVLEDILDRRRAELSAQLDRVRDAVEVGVRVVWDDDQPEGGQDRTARSGTDYLRSRAGAERRAEELADQLHTTLDTLARATHYRVATQTRGTLKAAFLVDRARLDEFVDRARTLEARITDAVVVCTGPWPPYSFVGTEDGPRDD